MTLGECINNYLNEHNMSMRTFAAAAGVSHTYISYIINGKTSRGDVPVPSIDKYRSIAKAMGIDVNELIAMVDDNIAWENNQTADDDDLKEELQILKDSPQSRSILRSTKGLTQEQLDVVEQVIKQMRRRNADDY